jgi:imidazolonepropionase-like amidohydrolase
LRRGHVVTNTGVFLFGARILDVIAGATRPAQSVLIREGRIAATGDQTLTAPSDVRAIDLRGMTLMPGLIDAHVHVTAATANFAELETWSPAYAAARAGELMRAMLMRGFTTVRDTGGADFGLAAAVEEAYLVGPRLIFGGKAISQTGGHGDMRGRGESRAGAHASCCPGLAVVADGVTEVRRTARDEIRRGAHHIKVMLSGGIASPTDRVDSTQYSIEEIRAVVDEAEAANRYVAGHAYTARAVNRGLACGVRSIEHGNLIDETSVALFLETGAFLVPTLVTYDALAKEGLQSGLTPAMHAKVSAVLEAGLRALDLAQRGGVRIAFGTDLIGAMQTHQSEEFALRARVQRPIDVIRAATITAAELLRMEGEIGVVAENAWADLLVIEGDPLEDLALLAEPERHVKAILKAGRFYCKAAQCSSHTASPAVGWW